MQLVVQKQQFKDCNSSLQCRCNEKCTDLTDCIPSPTILTVCIILLKMKIIFLSDSDDGEVSGKLAVVHLPRQSPAKAVPVQPIPIIRRIQVGDRGTAIGKGGEYVVAIHGSKLKVVFIGNDEESQQSVQ